MTELDKVKALVDRLEQVSRTTKEQYAKAFAIIGVPQPMHVCDDAAAELTRLAREVETGHVAFAAMKLIAMESERDLDALRAENARLRKEQDEALQLAEGPSTLKDLAATAFERGVENARLRSLLIECQSHLDGDPKSDELFERINECTK